MTEVIPAIMPKDFAELEEKMALMKGLVPLVQIDIMDGLFTPRSSWPYKMHDTNYQEIQRQERGLPFWEDVDFEADLMVKDPEKIVGEWVTAGATRIIIHIESTKEMQRIIDELKDIVEIGIAIGITTPLEKLEPFMRQIDFVQCMGINRIGFQGEEFDERVLEKIAAIKEKYPDLRISVDGGVNMESAPRLVEAGADRLVSGSAVFESDNFVEAIHTLENL